MVTALRVCADDDVICPACERYDKECDGSFNGPTFLMQEAATALESQQKRITELEAQNRWIPVTERLPEREGSYFVVTKTGAVTFARFYPERDLRDYRGRVFGHEPGQFQSNRKVSHWMPLPEAPKVIT